MSAEHCTCTQR